jgi:hypothetical protein
VVLEIRDVQSGGMVVAVAVLISLGDQSVGVNNDYSFRGTGNYCPPPQIRRLVDRSGVQ